MILNGLNWEAWTKMEQVTFMFHRNRVREYTNHTIEIINMCANFFTIIYRLKTVLGTPSRIEYAYIDEIFHFNEFNVKYCTF